MRVRERKKKLHYASVHTFLGMLFSLIHVWSSFAGYAVLCFLYLDPQISLEKCLGAWDEWMVLLIWGVLAISKRFISVSV